MYKGDNDDEYSGRKSVWVFLVQGYCVTGFSFMITPTMVLIKMAADGVVCKISSERPDKKKRATYQGIKMTMNSDEDDDCYADFEDDCDEYD